jgi:predicted outer membrane repeat protein
VTRWMRRGRGLRILWSFAAGAILAGCSEQDGPRHRVDTTPPAQVSDLHIAPCEDSLFLLTWTAPGDDGDEGRAAAYDIRHSLAASTVANWWDSAAVPLPDVPTPGVAGAVESLLVSRGSPDSTHFVALKTVDEAGNQSPISNVASYPPPPLADTIPPGCVQDLYARPTSSQSLLLIWSAPGDDGGEGNAAEYDIRCSTTADSLRDVWDLVAARLGQGLTPRPAGDHESLRVELLLPGTTYYFALRARDDESNWSAQSNIARGSTLPQAARFLFVAPEGSGDFATIQDAINAAVDGDVVELGEGTFTGQGNRALRYKGKAITVRSRSGSPANCIIDCEGASRGFEFGYGDDSLATVDGVTVSNGAAYRGGAIQFSGGGLGLSIHGCVFERNAGTEGGGIYVGSPGPKIESCVFRMNTAAAGGALLVDSRTQVRGCTFEGNEARSGGAIFCLTRQMDLWDCTFRANSTGSASEFVDGGAISCWHSTFRAQDCEFLENETAGCGGALFAGDSSNVTLTRCTLQANSAGQGGGAVALSQYALDEGSFIAEDCIFLDNVSDAPGGAIHCFLNSPRFTRCTLARNRAVQGGGAVFCRDGSSPVFANCILAFNESGGAIACEGATGEPAITCSDVFGNVGGDWTGCIAALLGLNGNISLDPQFCDLAAGDIRLMPASPCAAVNSPCGLMGASAEACPGR